MGHQPSLHSRPTRDTAIYQSDVTIDDAEEEEEDSYQSASTTLHKVTVPLPKPTNLFSKLTFAWARELRDENGKYFCTIPRDLSSRRRSAKKEEYSTTNYWISGRSSIPRSWQALVTHHGLQLCLLLFLCLSTKTAIENQYFDLVTNTGAQVRGTISAAIYQKAFRLGASGRQNVTTGEIINYMQIDAGRLEYVAGTIHTVWDGLLQILGYTSLLLYFLGPAVFAGLAAMLCIIPLNAYFLNRLSTVREENLKFTDRRVKLTNEILQGIRAVKSYNWEKPFQEKLQNIRVKELELLKAAGASRAVLVSVLFAAPSFVAVFSLAVFALMGNALDPTKVFTSLALFNQLRFPLTFFPMLLNSLAEGKVSLERITRYLQAQEVKGYVEKTLSEDDPVDTAVLVEKASFSWTAPQADNQTSESPSVGNYRGQLTDIDLNVRKGELIAIIGPTGCGKSTLLQALLGELQRPSNTGRVVVQGRTAFLPQTPWIPNDLLRNIILFGQPYNALRYQNALQVAGLSRDLENMEGGDLTEIGERGLTLSGGQKQRLSLARSVYEDADVYLLDDPLSALDSEVGKQVFRDCICGALAGKTRLLVTHQLNVLSQVDRVVLMENSRIVAVGTLRELVAQGYDLNKYIRSSSPSSSEKNRQEQVNVVSSIEDGVIEEKIVEEEVMNQLPTNATFVASETAEEVETEILVSTVPPTGALLDCVGSDCLVEDNEISTRTLTSSERSEVADDVPTTPTTTTTPLFARSKPIASPPSLRRVKTIMSKEERAEGAVGLSVYRDYLLEARRPGLLLLMTLAFLVANASTILQQYVVAAWTGDVFYRKHSLLFYLKGVAGMASSVAGFTFLRTYLFTLIGASASSSLHAKMVSRLLSAPLHYFESTPVGRIVQRFSKDLDQVDQQLPGSMGQLFASSLQIVASMAAICLVTPSFSIVMAVVSFIYLSVTNYYRPVAREMKRLESLSRSPVYSHFAESLQGLPVLRAAQRLSLYARSNAAKMDDNLAACFGLKAVDRWLCLRLEVLGNVVVLFAAVLAVLTGSRAGSTGLSLTNAMTITTLLNWAVRNAAETESLMNSVERVYFVANDTPQEEEKEERTPDQSVQNKHKDEELVKSGWPWKGELVFQDVVMRYREDFDPVLCGISLKVSPGERLGIVGRTGSGKSSLFRALLRLSEVEDGAILVDGVDIKTVGMHTLRSSISIIPQDPVLFTGSVRTNLDPFGVYSEEVLWTALRKAHLETFVRSLPDQLDFQVSEGGENFSQGQRQLLCLARALVRRSRILLLDEATSSVDFETDRVIQETIRSEFSDQGATVLTIAHRLRTIMDADKIVVMSNGQVREFAPPWKLLQNPDSLFSQLVSAEKREESRHTTRNL
eukprot:scaffold4203_cov166-Ochromonas_danica.AAC.8